jgi:integrase/recombinase XerD
MDYKRGRVCLKGVHPKTTKAYFSAINAYYDFLYFTKQISSNPIPSFRKRYLSRIKQQYNGDNSRQLISIEDMRALVSQDMFIQERAILILLAKTGIRRGELISIDLGDVNLDAKEITLKPKAKRTNRLVFFDDETALVLQVYMKWRANYPSSNAFFISPFIHKRVNRNAVNRIVSYHASILGLHHQDGKLNEKLTPHCFRHWFTTHLRRAGMSREFIQELRGDRRKAAIDIYDHIDLSELKLRYLQCIPSLIDSSVQLSYEASPTKPIFLSSRKARPQLAGRTENKIPKIPKIPSPQPIANKSGTGVSYAVFSLLAHNTLTITQIAERLNITYKSVDAVLTRNKKQGYVSNSSHEGYSLTVNGYKKLAYMDTIFNK